MKGLLVKTTGKVELVDVSEKTLVNDIQKLVGGIYDQCVLSEVFEKMDAVTFINDEGKLLDLPPSLALIDDDGIEIVDYVAGDIVVLGKDNEGNVCTMTPVQAALLAVGIETSGKVIAVNTVTGKGMEIHTMPIHFDPDEIE